MNKRILSALILNILVVIATTAIVISYFFHSNNPLVLSGFDSFKFFTTDSNVLAALTSLVLIPFEIRILRGKRAKLPHAAVVFKYVGMTAVMLTFMTVIVLLAPYYGLPLMYQETGMYMHLAGPLAALFTFLFLETDSRITIPESFLALVPSVLYGAVYLVEVIVIGEQNGGWMDFYTFNRGGLWYITMPVILVATYVIATVTRLIHNKLTKK